MPRGGKRPGAGRKPVLSYRRLIALGAECERRWREEWRKAEDRAIAEAHRLVCEQWAKAQAVPVPERADWLASPYGEDHLAEVRIALQQQQGIPLTDEDPEGADPARVIAIRARRPKGQRAAIIAAVARESGVSERRIEAAWKEFRRLEAMTRENA